MQWVCMARGTHIAAAAGECGSHRQHGRSSGVLQLLGCAGEAVIKAMVQLLCVR